MSIELDYVDKRQVDVTQAVPITHDASISTYGANGADTKGEYMDNSRGKTPPVSYICL
jgi:hypothetical protein